MTSFLSLLYYPLSVSLVDICGDSDDHIKGVVNTVGFDESVLDEGGQMFPIPDQLVMVA